MPNFVDEEDCGGSEDLLAWWYWFQLCIIKLLLRLVIVMLMLSNEHFPFLLFGCNGIQNLFDLIEGSLFIWFKDYCFVINMFSYILT